MHLLVFALQEIVLISSVLFQSLNAASHVRLVWFSALFLLKGKMVTCS